MRAPRRLDLQVFSPEEVRALVRAAADEQDAAIYLTAAFTGLWCAAGPGPAPPPAVHGMEG